MNALFESREILDWSTETTSEGISVVLPKEKANSNIVYLSTNGLTWHPVELPYSANWDIIDHDAHRFIVSASDDSTKKVISHDGVRWVDAGT